MVEDEPHSRAPSVYSSRAPSVHSSITLPPGLQRIVPPDHSESAIPADPKEEEIKQYEDGWETDSRNPRNWALGKKWLMVSIVRSPPVSFLTLGLFYDSGLSLYFCLAAC